MAVVFDASVLVDLFNSKLTGDRRAKLDHLTATLTKQRAKVLIPTPALAEFLVKAGKARDALLRELERSSTFAIEPFDKKASIECALLLQESWSRAEQGKVSRTKFKFDWQIVSIAASRNATAIYSDDQDIAKAAARRRISVYTTDSLPIPSSAMQRNISFDAESSDGDDR